MSDCTCSHPTPADGVSRRSVLRAVAASGLLAAAGTVAGEAAGTRYAFAAPTDPPGDVLVVLSLRGGFDGLNAVVPAADPDYARLRPTIGVPPSALLPLDRDFGLHPALAPLLPLWRSGKLGAVHAVGQADPSRSHFAATAELERAAPGSSLRTGWLERAAGLQPSPGAFAAAQVGNSGLSQQLAGPLPSVVVRSIKDMTLTGADSDAELRRWLTALRTMHAGAPTVLAQNASAALDAVSVCRAIERSGDTPANGASYPDGELGRALRDVVRLVRAEVGLRVAAVDVGDWDMHANMGTASSGWLSDKLTELGAALAAFATDLGPLLDGVTLLTLSEFGRRVEENGSGGVDHGHGNAMFLLGGGTVGGRVHGRWPGLSESALVDGDLAGTTDYRLVLGEILAKRCGIASAATVFPGLSGTPLGVTTARA